MMRLRAWMLVAMVTIASLTVAPVRAAPINTSEITQSALSTECLDYEVIGICVWMTCTAVGCYTSTSIKVSHYIPELVVSSYSITGENPWQDVAPMSQPTSDAEAGGNMTESLANDHRILRFKNADAIGHPGLVVYSALSGGYMCDAATSPLMPHFLSTLDSIGWRQGLIEALYPEALTPGLRDLGQPGDMWGNIYPRSGFINQGNDYRAAAIAAQRVADLVTRPASPHIYQPLIAIPREGYWTPRPVMESDLTTHKWQALSPSMEDSCAVWPDRGPMNTYQDRRDGSGDYVWALWRPYTCCQRRGEELIADTGGYGWLDG